MWNKYINRNYMYQGSNFIHHLTIICISWRILNECLVLFFLFTQKVDKVQHSKLTILLSFSVMSFHLLKVDIQNKKS